MRRGWSTVDCPSNESNNDFLLRHVTPYCIGDPQGASPAPA
jgi:hypothetical protein